MNVVFSGLAPLIVEEVADTGKQIQVRVRTAGAVVSCSVCGVLTARVHGYYQRRVDDVAVDARRVVLLVRVRRLVCPTYGCRRTFHEQLPCVLERYQRRTSRLASQVDAFTADRFGELARLRTVL